MEYLMYIRKIRIRNYKSISFLEFEPAKINIIVGRNSTGKSTILEAISLGASSPIYRDCLNHDILKNVIERSESSLIKFGNDSAEIELEISNKDDNITRRCVRILEVSKFMREYIIFMRRFLNILKIFYIVNLNLKYF